MYFSERAVGVMVCAPAPSPPRNSPLPLSAASRSPGARHTAARPIRVCLSHPPDMPHSRRGKFPVSSSRHHLPDPTSVNYPLPPLPIPCHPDMARLHPAVGPLTEFDLPVVGTRQQIGCLFRRQRTMIFQESKE